MVGVLTIQVGASRFWSPVLGQATKDSRVKRGVFCLFICSTSGAALQDKDRPQHNLDDSKHQTFVECAAKLHRYQARHQVGTHNPRIEVKQWFWMQFMITLGAVGDTWAEICTTFRALRVLPPEIILTRIFCAFSFF